MRVVSYPVRTYRLEVTERELGALERACEARIREMRGDTNDDLSRSMPALLRDALRDARQSAARDKDGSGGTR